VTPILELNNIRGGYGTIDVLHGVSLKLGKDHNPWGLQWPNRSFWWAALD